MEKEVTKRKKKRGKTRAAQDEEPSSAAQEEVTSQAAQEDEPMSAAREEVPPMADREKGPVSEQDSSIESDILDALIDSEHLTFDQACNSNNIMALNYLSSDWLENEPSMEVNGNRTTIDIQETALTEVVVMAPTAPAVEENFAVPELIDSAETIPAIEEMVVVSGEDQRCCNDFLAVCQANQVALFENRELLAWKEYSSVLADSMRLVTSNNQLLQEKVDYLSKLRDRIEMNDQKLGQLQILASFQTDNVWSFEKRKVTETGECQDGNPVTAELDYAISHFNGVAHEDLSKTLSAIKEVCYESMVLNLHEAELTKDFLDKYVNRICNPYLVKKVICPPAVLLQDFEQARLQLDTIELQACIVMLIKFIRGREEKDLFSCFVIDLLKKVVSVFLRVATWKDHMFLLHQVLGFPGKIPKWMIDFVQVPFPPDESLESPFTNRYLDHLICVLSVLMSPIEHRRPSFADLRDIANASRPSTARVAEERDSDVTSWFMIDSDGEEDVIALSGEIKSNNIIELFDQLPLKEMYSFILKMKKNEFNEYLLDITVYNDQYMVELFAFCTGLIHLYEQGLHTYGRPQYQQFAKGLGQLIKHTVQYVTDVFHCYRDTLDPKAALWHLQCKYDMFFIRAVNAIYSSKDLGIWQFLVTLPYQCLSKSALWRLFYILHVKYDPNIEKNMPRNLHDWIEINKLDQVAEVFEVRLCTLPDSGAMYLLSGISSMALPKEAGSEDFRQFAQTATLALFKIGYLSEETQEKFSKHIRTLLAAITTNHPWLISSILCNMTAYNFIKSERLCLDLFKDLPLTLWLPRAEDLAIIRRWLCDKPLLSVEFGLARLILNGLNYSISEEDNTEVDLVIGHNLHCTIALMVAEAALGFTETQGHSTATNTGVLSDMITKIVGSGSCLEYAYKWAWGLLLRLRIHNLDRGKTIPRETIFAPQIYLQGVPDLYGSPDLQVISNGVLLRQPIACFVALIMTTYGHSVPLICRKGFPLILDVLLRNQLYRESIACISLLVPMFINCPDSLIACDTFHSIVVALCSADRGFMRMARNLMNYDFPGPVLRLMGSMVEFHLHNCRSYGLEKITSLWLGCLAKVPDWVNDNAVLYLMDIILRKAFFCWDSQLSATKVLNQEFLPSSIALETNEALNTATQPTGSELINWMRKSVGPPIKSLMSRISLPATPWFAIFVLLAEKEWQETEQLWYHIQMELHQMQPGATNVDKAIKAAISYLRLPTSMPACNLAIYRWGQQAIDTPIGHPLLPFIWHVFFLLYLARVPSDQPKSLGSVGYKFYEGAVGQQTLKRMKKQLLETANHFNTLEAALVDSAEDDPQQLRGLQPELTRLQTLSKLFKTYHLWLEDTQLMSNVVLSNLEPMYDIPRLEAIFNNDDYPGRLLLNGPKMFDSQQKNLVEWEKALNRYSTSNRISNFFPKYGTSTMDDTNARLALRLNSHKTPNQACPMPTFLHLDCAWKNYRQMVLIPHVKEQLGVLTSSGRVYSNNLAEHTGFVYAILECLPLVHSNVKCEKVLTAMCHSSPPHRGTNYHARESTCAGHAEIRVVVTESKENDLYKNTLEESQKGWQASLKNALNVPRYETCAALIALEEVVTELIEEKAYNRALSRRELCTEEAGVTTFFQLILGYTEQIAFFPPSREMVHKCLSRLASVFLNDGYYAEQLLHALLQDLRLAPVLCLNFRPVEASTSKFICMYEQMVMKAYIEPDYKSFAMILMQFDVRSWLKNHHTTLADRSTLIEEIAKAISAAGLQPDENKEMLHTAFRKDLVVMLMYEFPENFGNILNHLLRASALQRVSLDVWYDFINSLMQNDEVQLGIEMPKLRDEIRHFANEHNTLPYQEVLQTSQLLGTYFLAERNKFGLYGLYPKYRTYVEPIMAFQALIGHLLTVSWLAYEEGQLSMIICYKLWQSLEAMYSPWIAPLWTEQLEEPVASWIDQLTEDRSVMLPWIPPDKQHASRAVMMFVEGVRFILDSVSVDILSHLWQYYVTKFAHNSVPENVLMVIHTHFETLPWQQFRPTFLDIDLMFKVVTQSVPPDVHCFLGTIFVNVAWLPWLNHTMHVFRKTKDQQVKIHVYMLHLHVKMAREKEVRKKSKITEMLSVAKKFEWHLVDATSYGQVIDWWVFHYDPRVAAGLSQPYINPIDKCVMNLLEVAAGFTTEAQQLHPTTMYKRIFYVRGIIKMLIKCTNEDRTIVEKNLNAVSGVVYSLLTSIENITQRTVAEEHRLTECTLLVREVAVIFNQPESSELKKMSLKICTSWLQRENCMSYVVRGFLGVLGTDITNPAIMGQLLETCFTAYFKNTVMQESTPSWYTAVQLLSPPMVPNVEETLLTSGYFLTLHALLFKQMAGTKSVREEITLLTNLVEWICQVKPSVLVESKLPLLWGIALLLVHRQCELCENLASVTRSVRRLISHFSEMSEEKSQIWSLLGTLGLRKHQVLSPKGRLLCRSMSAFLLAQLPEGSNDKSTLRVNPSSPGAIAECQANGEGGVTLVASGDAVRALRDLEALAGMKSNAEIKDTIELAIKLIKDPNQTINTAKEVLGALTVELYREQYLHILTGSN